MIMDLNSIVRTVSPLSYQRKNTLDVFIISLPVQFENINSPDRLSDQDIGSGTLKVVTHPSRNIGESLSISEM